MAVSKKFNQDDEDRQREARLKNDPDLIHEGHEGDGPAASAGQWPDLTAAFDAAGAPEELDEMDWELLAEIHGLTVAEAREKFAREGKLS